MTGAAIGSIQQSKQCQDQPILFAATWTTDPTKGVYTYKFDTTDGSLKQWAITPLSFATGGINPTYLQESTNKLHEGKRLIYALNRATNVGYVSALTLNANGTLDLINTQQMRGGSPAHATLSPNEDFVAVSNYAGSLSLFPLNKNGTVAPETYYKAFPNGSRVVMDQQATGHIHSTRWLPNSNHVVAVDLGGDSLLQYELDAKAQTLNSLETVSSPPGSGPRHSVLSANGDYLYVANEISNTVSVYKIKQQEALLINPAIQKITTLPPNFTNSSTVADIHLSKNGKFVYVSNRGHDSIAIYAINEADGTLRSLGWESTRGQTPRGFTVYDDWLIVANQKSNDMYIFKVDEHTGLLTYTGNSYPIDAAVCLKVSLQETTTATIEETQSWSSVVLKDKLTLEHVAVDIDTDREQYHLHLELENPIPEAYLANAEYMTLTWPVGGIWKIMHLSDNNRKVHCLSWRKTELNHEEVEEFAKKVEAASISNDPAKVNSSTLAAAESDDLPSSVFQWKMQLGKWGHKQHWFLRDVMPPHDGDSIGSSHPGPLTAHLMAGFSPLEVQIEVNAITSVDTVGQTFTADVTWEVTMPAITTIREDSVLRELMDILEFDENQFEFTNVNSMQEERDMTSSLSPAGPVNFTDSTSLALPLKASTEFLSHLQFSRRVTAAFSEEMTLRSFPVDQQKLTFAFSTGAGVRKSLRITPGAVDAGTFAIANYKLGNVFDVVHHDKVFVGEIDTEGDKKGIRFEMMLERRPGYYVTNVAIPAGIITYLCFISYAPLSDGSLMDTGDRVQIVLTLLLTAVTFKNMVASLTPQISYFTTLDQYVFFCFIISCLVAIENALFPLFSVVFLSLLRLQFTAKTRMEIREQDFSFSDGARERPVIEVVTKDVRTADIFNMMQAIEEEVPPVEEGASWWKDAVTEEFSRQDVVVLALIAICALRLVIFVIQVMWKLVRLPMQWYGAMEKEVEDFDIQSTDNCSDERLRKQLAIVRFCHLQFLLVIEKLKREMRDDKNEDTQQMVASLAVSQHEEGKDVTLAEILATLRKIQVKDSRFQTSEVEEHLVDIKQDVEDEENVDSAYRRVEIRVEDFSFSDGPEEKHQVAIEAHDIKGSELKPWPSGDVHVVTWDTTDETVEDSEPIPIPEPLPDPIPASAPVVEEENSLEEVAVKSIAKDDAVLKRYASYRTAVWWWSSEKTELTTQEQAAVLAVVVTMLTVVGLGLALLWNLGWFVWRFYRERRTLNKLFSEENPVVLEQELRKFPADLLSLRIKQIACVRLRHLQVVSNARSLKQQLEAVEFRGIDMELVNLPLHPTTRKEMTFAEILTAVEEIACRGEQVAVEMMQLVVPPRWRNYVNENLWLKAQDESLQNLHLENARVQQLSEQISELIVAKVNSSEPIPKPVFLLLLASLRQNSGSPPQNGTNGNPTSSEMDAFARCWSGSMTMSGSVGNLGGQKDKDDFNFLLKAFDEKAEQQKVRQELQSAIEHFQSAHEPEHEQLLLLENADSSSSSQIIRRTQQLGATAAASSGATGASMRRLERWVDEAEIMEMTYVEEVESAQFMLEDARRDSFCAAIVTNEGKGLDSVQALATNFVALGAKREDAILKAGEILANRSNMMLLVNSLRGMFDQLRKRDIMKMNERRNRDRAKAQEKRDRMAQKFHNKQRLIAEKIDRTREAQRQQEEEARL
ncbi:hypothetical protein PHPALM_30765, partial [Phytophthora palmivora]